MNKEELENRDEYLVKELNKIIEGITLSEHFKEYDWRSIRVGCQIEFDFYLKELNKGSDLDNLIFRFEKSVNERVLKNITKENESEFEKCLKLFLEFYKNEIKRKYLNLI